MDQVILEPERTILDACSWSWSPKFEFRLHSPGSNYCEPCPWLLPASFSKQIANRSALVLSRFHRSCWSQDDCGIYYACAVLGWNLLSNIFRGNFSSNISLTFRKTSGKRSLHLVQTSDHPW